MPERIVYEGAAKFSGSVRQFIKFRKENPFVIDPDWKDRFRRDGMRPPPIARMRYQQITKQYARGLRRIKVGPIPGGIRNFHLEHS